MLKGIADQSTHGQEEETEILHRGFSQYKAAAKAIRRKLDGGKCKTGKKVY